MLLLLLGVNGARPTGRIGGEVLSEIKDVSPAVGGADAEGVVVKNQQA